MKHYAMPAAIATVGLGLLSIGFNLNGNQANATPAAFNAGPVEPTIVWYDVAPVSYNTVTKGVAIYRAWSDGTIEARIHGGGALYASADCDSSFDNCVSEWVVIANPNEGLNARADINFDERVDAADLGQLIAAWGDAPRNDYPPSDCPLGLIP
jgi:hypothetical protein